jgi:hypothetical protein
MRKVNEYLEKGPCHNSMGSNLQNVCSVPPLAKEQASVLASTMK